MLNYNAPIDGQKSTIDGTGSDQMHSFRWLKAAIIEARREQYFMQMASMISMPKHFGKTIKRYVYIPLLDDRNINDQGIDANGVTIVNGNLYGSSKDVGTIVGKLPFLGENGGRVNRVGFTRLTIEGSLHKFGFFTEFTQESLDFDSDAELMMHLSRELMNGAVQMTEAILQKDLLAAAGVIVFAGGALDEDEITAEVVSSVPASIVDFADFQRLNIILNDNRTPKQTKVITGSRNVDTRVINGGRVAYCGSELQTLIEGMVDQFDRPAFVPVAQYGAATTLMNGEIGSVGHFRIVIVPEMQHWAGVGAEVAVANPGYHSTVVSGDEHYDVFPILVIGDDSFNTLGFQLSNGSGKFNVLTKMPGKETANRNDPYGETGFSSMKWFYGFLCNRPERIAVIKTVAPI
jgi:N4-gp56 family major capsid protein